LLVLFDGLDEVPTELLGQMTGAIENLVDRYSKNRFIASCRIAAYRSFKNFSRFTDVAIANCDDQQIRCFIDNWFKSHDRPGWGEECQARLNSDDHRATRELAQTSLLLTLICILFLKRGEFPTKKATLYGEAVWTLLAEWDASKDIVRQQPYKGLDTKRKEIMLAEIACSNFSINNLFLQKWEIVQQIEQILAEMLDEKRIDGRDVLRAVEEQHGLLVNRYDDIYSFSHLTIQEFLTAKHIIDNSLDMSAIVKEHLFDKRWREVFCCWLVYGKLMSCCLLLIKRL
jgi:predicted NACHT family NTPase